MAKPDEVDYYSSSLGYTSTVVSGSNTTYCWRFDNIGSQSGQSFTVTVNVTSGVASGTVIKNNATLNARDANLNWLVPEVLSNTVSTLVTDGADLQMGKAVNVSTADPGDLIDKLRQMLVDPDRLSTMRRAARAEFDKRYTKEANYRQLISIYHRAVGMKVTEDCTNELTPIQQPRDVPNEV